MIRAGALALALAAPSPALADLLIDLSIAQACVDAAGPDQAAPGCIGQAANRCMEDSPQGYSTVQMGACLDAELGWWDGLLNTEYRGLMAELEASDADLPAHLAVQAGYLRDMQRAWIRLRDSACAFEASRWQGGTGASPAAIGCLLQRTAQQALFLRNKRDGQH